MILTNTRDCWQCRIDSLAIWGCGNGFTSVFFKLILRIDILSTSCKHGLMWMPLKSIDDNSAYCATRPQWVNTSSRKSELDIIWWHIDQMTIDIIAIVPVLVKSWWPAVILLWQPEKPIDENWTYCVTRPQYFTREELNIIWWQIKK